MAFRVQLQTIIFAHIVGLGLFLGRDLKAESILGHNHEFVSAQLADATNSLTPADPTHSEKDMGANRSEGSKSGKEAQSNSETQKETSADTPGDGTSPSKSQSEGGNGESGTSHDPVQEQFLRFHQFSLGIELSRPKFSKTDLPLYEDYYGKEALMLGFRLDWDVLRNKYLALGLLFRVSHYSDSGYASKSATDYVKDDNAPVDITLIPLQLGVSLKLTPFSKKWLVINGWVGMERLFFQETRGSITDDATTASTSTSTTATSGQEEVDSGVLTNKGWAQHVFTGVSLNILLNPLEEQPVKAASFLGIERVYLSPFFETSVPSQNKDRTGVKFKRTTYGVAFIFETRGI